MAHAPPMLPLPPVMKALLPDNAGSDMPSSFFLGARYRNPDLK
jgi:hypothetical protein